MKTNWMLIAAFALTGCVAEERSRAMWCHLSALGGYLIPFAGLIAPLVIWLLNRERSPFIDDQGKEAVNFRISMYLYYFGTSLLAGPEVIRAQVGETLASFGRGEGHVFNLGHGITPDVDPDNLAALIAAVREFSPAYHQG